MQINLLESSIIIACGFYWIYLFLERKICAYGEHSHPIFISKYVSIIHATLVVTCCLCYFSGLFDIGVWQKLQCIPIGYCLYDTILGYSNTRLYLKRDRLIPFHHFIFIIFAYYVFPSYPQEVTIAYLAEISNPFLHICYHMINTSHHKDHPILFLVLSICLIITFFVFRVLNFAYLTCVAFRQGVLLNISGSVTLLILNVNWFWRLIKKARQHFLE